MSKVSLPILSNSNDDPEIVRYRFLIMTKVVAYITIPICIGIAIFSKETLWIVYGSEYVDASIIVILFAFISIFNSICSFYDMLGIAKGRTDLNFYNTIVRILITTPIIVVVSNISINAVAYGQLLATILQSIAFWFIVVNNTYPISFKYYFSHFSKWLYIQLGCFILMKIIMLKPLYEYFSVINIVINAVVYILLTVFVIVIFMRPDINYFKNLLKR